MHRFAAFIVGFAVLLVWWGAAVTTKDVGLAVPDWPLCYRRINPEGWWKVMALMLEHGHRWLATIVYWLVFAFFTWQWFRRNRGIGRWLEWAALLVALMAVIALTAVAASPFNRQPSLFVPAALLGAGLAGWLVHGLMARGWAPLLKVSALALLLVELQAVLGGMRVTEMSDAFGIVHGVLGQLFYCLLLLMALRASPRWGSHWRDVPTGTLRRWRGAAFLLFGAVFLQLVWGAALRHLHRVGLPADDILTTGGRFFPGFGDGPLFFFFMHKAWALLVCGLAILLGLRVLRSAPSAGGARALTLSLLLLLGGQVVLGVSVVMTGTSFWVTNFHVLNGLAILACSFAFLVRSAEALRPAPAGPVASIPPARGA